MGSLPRLRLLPGCVWEGEIGRLSKPEIAPEPCSVFAVRRVEVVESIEKHGEVVVAIEEDAIANWAWET